MKKQPLVSIITPTFNSRKFFLETFESVMRQTYSSWEWIIIDDCSTDGTFDYIHSLIKNDKRISLMKNKINSGAAVARNLGIAVAKGEILMFLDSDDLWLPNKLQIQVGYMVEKEICFTYSDYNVLTPQGKIKKFAPKSLYSDFKMLLHKNDIGCLTVALNINKLGKLYMPTDTPKREDYAMWLDITKQGIIAHKIPCLLATYRLSPDSISSNKFRMLKYHYNVYRKHLKFSRIASLFYLFIHTFNKIFRKY